MANVKYNSARCAAPFFSGSSLLLRITAQAVTLISRQGCISAEAAFFLGAVAFLVVVGVVLADCAYTLRAAFGGAL